MIYLRGTSSHVTSGAGILLADWFGYWYQRYVQASWSCLGLEHVVHKLMDLPLKLCMVVQALDPFRGDTILAHDGTQKCSYVDTWAGHNIRGGGAASRR